MSEGWIRQLESLGRLQGSAVVLEPLAMAHLEPLWAVARDPELWRWGVSVPATPAKLADYLEAALRERAQHAAFPYATLSRDTGEALGSTRFAAMDAAHRRVEIGWTWVGRQWQRTAVNTETKYLLLETAFERLGCVRVEFKADAQNEKSRAALRRIGAQEEGVLRRHMITASGRHRDSVYYSILDLEWPAVKAALRARLASG